MPPHCDSMDGPVVIAARAALDANDVDLVLPYVHAEGEQEIRDAFDSTVKVRALGAEAQDLADRWFFETVVRVHRAGEGAAFTGLKPAGLDVGPIIPAAERAVAQQIPEGLIDALCNVVGEQVVHRYAHVMALKNRADAGVPAARAYVEAFLGLQVWSHKAYKALLDDSSEHSARQA